MTKAQLAKISDKLDYDEVMPLLEKYEINTPQRVAMFLAQCAHESGDFKRKRENLHYHRGDRLKAVFGKYFKGKDVNHYLCNSEKVANLVYANRMGNGDESSGDGYRYCGRGYIQLTGKNNYAGFAEFAGMELNDDLLKYLESDKGALHSALYFWSREQLNKYADTNDIKACTRRINGGFNGLQDRENKYKKYLAILSGWSEV